MIQPSPTAHSRNTCVLSLSGGIAAAFRFGAGDLIEIGRSRDCAIPIDDRFASRRHCRIGLVPGEGLVLRDLGSSNGTLLNGSPVERAVLRSGDMIEIGALELRVQISAGPAQGGCVHCGAAVPTGAVAAAPVACSACSDAPPALPPVDVIRTLAKEGYQVLQDLGTCGPVRRFRARRMAFAQEVFLEVLPFSASITPKEVTRFVDGAQAQAALRHKNVASVYDVRQRRELLLVVLEQIPGETLRSTLERGGRKRLAVKEALRIAYQIASALAHLHERDVVHRDIKPDNVLITPEGDAKLINFGMAKIVSTREDVAGTAFGKSLGTPGYMAPEQIHTARYADVRADIYGLGATLYHCLSGRSADRESAPSDQSALSPLAEVPRVVVALLMRMVQPKPEDRFRTPHFVLRAIEAVATQLTGVAADATNIDLLLRLEHDESDLFLTPARAQPRPTAAFTGRIQDMALVEFLQMLEFNGKSGTLTVSDRGFNAQVLVREGYVIDAEAGATRGQSVVQHALELAGGEFSFEPHLVAAPTRQDKTVRIGRLLLEHLRTVDEGTR